MKSLEQIYSKMLGSPIHGDLNDLEKKYQEIGSTISSSQESEKVDISTIQRHGELHNAYLYLKTQWTINRQKKSELIIDGLNLNAGKLIKRKTSIGIQQKDLLQKFHNRLRSMTKVGIATIIVITIYQSTKSYFWDSSVFASSDRSVLEQAIVEINNQKADQAQTKPVIDNGNLIELKDSISEIDENPKLIIAAKNCSLQELTKALNNGISINTKGSSGENIAHWLSRLNCPAELSWALKRGANPLSRDNSGRTAEDWAKISNAFESIQVLNRHATGKL